jgi:hypothetical protein
VTFKKGHSGNPGGRPAAVLDDGRTIADVAREHTVEAVETLVSVMRDGEQPGAARVSAANAILDRGWGKPKQELGVEVTNNEALVEALERGRQRVLAY